MKHTRKWRKPSPAMIVAIAALSVSLVGTAVAGPIAEISLNKGEKKQIRKISRNISNKVSDRKITQRAPALSVAAAQNAIAAETAKSADSAKTADTVPDGTISTPKLANDSVNGSKVVDGSLLSPDLGPNSVGSSEIANGSLDDVDVGVASGSFTHDIPNITANDCLFSGSIPAPGVSVGDHIIVTVPNAILITNVIIEAGVLSNNNIRINQCNPTGSAEDPASATFSWLAIDQ